MYVIIYRLSEWEKPRVLCSAPTSRDSTWIVVNLDTDGKMILDPSIPFKIFNSKRKVESAINLIGPSRWMKPVKLFGFTCYGDVEERSIQTKKKKK